VGVAPALGIVYVLGGMISNLWRGGKGRGRWGGKRRRREGWEGMRRIERLLITQGLGGQQQQRRQIETQGPLSDEDDVENARSTGLLFLSLSRLQAYASRYLPLVVRQAFLEDLEDLANPQLAREEKLLVVSRVWRCWGGVGGVLEA
jgi:nuclear control of ATPase protein 2